MRFRTQVGGWAAAAVCALPAAQHSAAAQGFGLNEIGSCAIARGFAATGAPCDDASVLYWNPAAATTLRGLSAYIGGSAIQVKGRFTADTTARAYEGDVPVEFPPFVGVAWKGSGARTSRLALGLAAYVPYGLTSQWREDFPGRFAAQKASLQTIYVQPTIAYEVVPGRLSLGVGAIYGHSSLELRQGIDLSQQRVPSAAVPAGTTFAQFGIAPGTEFGRAQLEGSGSAFGAQVGAYLRVSDALTLGARYLTSLKFDYEGDATFTPVATGLTLAPSNPLAPGGASAPVDALVAGQFTGSGALTPQGVKTSIEHPAQFQVGLGFKPTSRTTLSLDYALTQWDAFQELAVDFQGAAPDRTIVEEYENTSSVRAGLEHRFGGSALGGMAGGATGAVTGGVAGRLGFAYAQGAAPDQTVTPLLPDMDRYEFGGGLGLPLGGRFALDAAYLRVETKGRRGRLNERPDGLGASQTVQTLNNGFFNLNANVFSLSLKANF
jgi:long-chain fatty acid transport protein